MEIQADLSLVMLFIEVWASSSEKRPFLYYCCNSICFRCFSLRKRLIPEQTLEAMTLVVNLRLNYLGTYSSEIP